MIYSPVDPVSWSLQHPQAGFPDEDAAVSLFFRLESGLSILMHNGIKLPALEQGSSPFPINGRRSVSHSLHMQISGLEPTWPTRSGHTEQIVESSRNGEWEAAAPSLKADPAFHFSSRTFVVLTLFTAEELKYSESVLYSKL